MTPVCPHVYSRHMTETKDLVERPSELDPITYPAGPQTLPYVLVGDDNQLEIHWPTPTPEWFQMHSDLFASLIDEINNCRRSHP